MHLLLRPHTISLKNHSYDNEQPYPVGRSQWLTSVPRDNQTNDGRYKLFLAAMADDEVTMYRHAKQHGNRRGDY